MILPGRPASGFRLLASGIFVSLALAGVVRGQDEPLDADPRAYDRIWLQGEDAPIECTILEGADANSANIRFKKKQGGIEVTLARGNVTRVVLKQTPLDALKERAERIKNGTSEEHRKLGDWAWRTGLEPEALGELRKSVQVAKDAASSVPFRARLARVLILRAAHVDADAREDVWEELLKLGKASEKLQALSPEVELGIARALLAQGLAAPAIPHLERAREGISKEASGPPVVEEAPPVPAVKKDDTPKVDDTPKKPDPPKKDDGTRKVGPRRGDRDGEGGPRDVKPKDPPKPDAPPAEDHSQEKWPGIVSDRRLVFRDILLALADAYLKTDRAKDAAAALDPLIAAWPQDKTGLALRAQAKLASGDGAGAVQDLGTAITANPDDATLVTARGIANYVANDLDAARADLEKAIAAGLEDPRLAQAHLGLVHLRCGRFKAAKVALDAANAGEPCGLAKLGLGVLAELQGRADDAANLYEEARPLLEQDGLVSYSVALARLKGQKPDDARLSITTALREGLPFPVGERALAAIARSVGDGKAEVKALEELVGSGVRSSPDDLYALGRAYLTVERLDDARLTFDKAVAAVATHTPSLLGAGWVRYASDDREGAREFFQRALAAVGTEPAAQLTPEAVFARRALKNLEDARTRKVWIERFDREDTNDVKNGWTPVLGFGVEVGIKGKRLVFDGTQSRDTDGGKTRLWRDFSGQTVVKAEARLDLTKAPDARAGIRFETERGSAILYRDKDDLQIATSLTGTTITTDPVKIWSWPKDDRPHTIAIEVEDPAAGIVSFWLDGERRGDVKIGQIGRAQKPVVGVFVAAPVGTAFTAVCEEVRVYALKPAAPGKSGGY